MEDSFYEISWSYLKITGCGPMGRSDTAENGICSGQTRFALNNGNKNITNIKSDTPGLLLDRPEVSEESIKDVMG